MAFTSPQGKTSTSLSEINVTPLVDVMLVLLIIFMVTAPILETGIDVQLPETTSVATVDPEERVVITIGRDNLIYYRSQPVNFYEIADRLKREIRNPREPIYLRGDKDVKWGSLASVLDVIRGAGFTHIQIVTKPLQRDE
ncbi:MAG: biopolymer transporter ExbD [Acidobacteria bacterium]|nr:biopolymer transporter ExbD [Acidobacteriota bacterium]